MKIEKTSGSKYIWKHEGLYVSKLDFEMIDILTAGMTKASSISGLDITWEMAEMYTIDMKMDSNRENWFLWHIEIAYDTQKKKILDSLD